jgi:hypothetical protein
MRFGERACVHAMRRQLPGDGICAFLWYVCVIRARTCRTRGRRDMHAMLHAPLRSFP